MEKGFVVKGKEKMRETIYRDDAIDAICKACSIVGDYHKCNGYPETSTWCEELVALRALPSAEPERKKGKWLELTNTNHTYVCSVCGRTLVNITDGKNKVTKNYPFCHCGADMRGEQDE